MCQPPKDAVQARTAEVSADADVATPGSTFSPLFGNFTGVMMRAKRQPLELSDLLLMSHTDNATLMADKICDEWKAEVARYEIEKAQNPDKAKKPSLGAACFKIIRPLWLPAVLLYATGVGLSFFGPIVVRWTLTLITEIQYCSIALTVLNGTVLNGTAADATFTGIADDCSESQSEMRIGQPLLFPAVTDSWCFSLALI